MVDIKVCAVQETFARLTKAPASDFPTIAFDYKYEDACGAVTTMRVAASGVGIGQVTCIEVVHANAVLQLGSMSAAEARACSRRVMEIGSITLRAGKPPAVNPLEKRVDFRALLHNALDVTQSAHAPFADDEIAYFINNARPTILFPVYKTQYPNRKSNTLLLNSRLLGI